MVLFLFFCSGATALIYEVIWSKSLSLMFGSTVQAQTVVLAVFMGGLALGNRIIGARADLLRRPLAAYGCIEAIIGLYAFFFTWIYHHADSFFVWLGSSMLDKPMALLFLKGGISISLLLVPTILMGGTLPLLAAWLQRNSANAGQRSAIFYSVNSLGAVFGSFLAGFILVQAMGLPATLQMTGFANVAIGVIALALARRVQDHSPNTTRAEEIKPSGPANVLMRRVCFMVALSGAVAMGLEVVSSRCLAMVFGASLEAFALVLISFILGIGLGSAVIGSRRFSRYLSEKTIFGTLILAAVWIGVLVFGIEELVFAFRLLKSGLASTSMGYRLNEVLTVCASLIVLGIPAALIGAVLPMCIRMASGASTSLGQSVGRLLTWNTLGGVIGVLLTGFVLMPVAGLRASFSILAGTLCAAAILIAWSKQERRLAQVGGIILLLIAMSGIFGGQGWRHILSSGIFRLREKEVLSEGMDIRRKDINIVYYKDAPDATVSVERSSAGGNMINLRINGKVDASSHGDFATQCLLAHLPMAIRPESKDVFVIGLGSGITGGAMLSHPIDHLTIAENCKPVIEAAAYFNEFNVGVLTNARTHIVREDARTVLKLTHEQYDIIISEPSNPWMAGVGSVFSREFYQLCSKRLKPKGMITQWFHVYEMSDEIVFLVLRTFRTVFPYVEIWDTGSGDLVLLGSNEPFTYRLDVAEELFKRDIPRKHLEQIGLPNPKVLWARQIASQQTAFAIAGPGPIQTDDFPVLEYAAPRAFFIGQTARRVFDFDERTWQSGIAPAEKRKVLSSLSEAEVQGCFKNVSVNPDLQTYVGFRNHHHDPSSVVQVEKKGMPCIFRPLDSMAADLFLSNSDQETFGKLAEVEAMIYSTNRLQGIQSLDSTISKGALSPNESRLVEELVVVAVKECLRVGDNQSAQQLVNRASQLKAGSIELSYLTRIVQERVRN
ncbi:MAG: spermine/spermidine synthase family protein [Verrucomicrobiales bacterium]|nr:spermine/spermidine synthase family protein [Verrucomicrobiales bacterium]